MLHSCTVWHLLLYNVRNPSRQKNRGLFCLDHEFSSTTVMKTTSQSLIKILIFTITLCSLKAVIAPGSTLRSISFSEWADTEQCYIGKLYVFPCQLYTRGEKNTPKQLELNLDHLAPQATTLPQDHCFSSHKDSHILCFTLLSSLRVRLWSSWRGWDTPGPLVRGVLRGRGSVRGLPFASQPGPRIRRVASPEPEGLSSIR